jgi:hypothetical protein
MGLPIGERLKEELNSSAERAIPTKIGISILDAVQMNLDMGLRLSSV